MKYYLLNVFSRQGQSGNQLAAVFPEKDLTTEQMQLIARNFNFSETVFFTGNCLRIFTPNSELPFAGHPTVGAAWLLHHLGKVSESFSLFVPRGEVKAQAWDKFAQITFPGQAAIKPMDVDLEAVLGYAGVSLSDVELELVRNVNVGPEFTVIPLRSRNALTRAYPPLLSPAKVKLYFTYRESKSNYFVRMFAPAISVPEDPATGAAACALGGFIEQVLGEAHGVVKISQGRELGRECAIDLKWDKSIIQIGGEVTLWGSGNLV